MGQAVQIGLRYKHLWLLIGYAMVCFVVYQSLISSPIQVDVHLSDKIYHLVGYFGLMAWFVQIYHSQTAHVICGVLLIIMGISLEFLQDYGGVRYYEVNDMIANAGGVVLAWLLAGTSFSKCLNYLEKHLP